MKYHKEHHEFIMDVLREMQNRIDNLEKKVGE